MASHPHYLFFLLILSLFWLSVAAQEKDTVGFDESLSNLSDFDSRTSATFKTTRIANGHTVEQCKPGVLDLRINHRFGRLSDGLYNFLGLDNAVTRIGFDYGMTDYLMVGVGRSTLNKEFDGFAKVRVLGQSSTKIPVTVNYVAGAYIVTERTDLEDRSFFNRVTYLHQLLIARKFNERLSIQLMPTLVHFNMTDLTTEPNTIGSLGVGGRYKITNRTALTLEYYNVPDHFKRDKNFNPLTVGFDIETGGHVFQLFFSNAMGISERSLFTHTRSKWEDGQLHFGFNISRVFSLR